MSQGVPTPIPSRPPGQPTRCTQTIIDIVCTRLRAGGYPTIALEAEGLDGSNHHYWLDKARQDIERGEETIYTQYSQAVKAAIADRELSLAALVADAAAAGPQYWAAGMTYLERRHPDRWGRREPVAPAADVRVQIIHYGGPLVQPVVEVRQLAPAPAPDGD